MKHEKLKQFLERKTNEFNQRAFIVTDPVCIPHKFSKKQDIEIAGFFAAVFAWGNRKTIINKSAELMQLMDNSPHQFCIHHSDAELRRLVNFKHRTFNATDLLYFISFFKIHYSQYASLETAFSNWITKNDVNVENAINGFYQYFFSLDEVPTRTLKHIAAPAKKSTCKRLNMFLRWMVRKDDNGVDFGIWNSIKSSQLVIPVDLHVARVARHFKLLERPVVDWAAAVELTEKLKEFDSGDPVKFDFALFGLGVLEKY